MPLHLTLAVTIVVATAFYISIMNPISIDFHLTRNISYNIPLVVVVLAGIFIGSLLVALMDAIRASGQGISRLRASAQDKRSHRLHQPYDRGLQYLEAGYAREAEEEFQKVLERDPKHVPSLIELGKIKLKKGEHEEALKLHNRALTLDGENLEAAFCVAQDYAETGRYQKARSVLEGTRKFVCDQLVTLTRLREVCIDGELWEDALKVQKEIVHLTKDREQAERETTIL
ncbi:MAG: tetratricopeptide repeat protein, partial [Dehalococcoidia bacterium]